MISQRLRSPGILDATPYLHAGYRCCAACTSGHPYTSFLNWQRGQARAKDNNLYPVWDDDTIWKMLGHLCSRRRRTTNYKWAQLGSNQRPTSYEPTVADHFAVSTLGVSPVAAPFLVREGLLPLTHSPGRTPAEPS